MPRGTLRPVEQILADDAGLLEAEIRSYLAAVEVFRREGCEPTWSAEAAEDGCEPCVSGPRDPRFERRSA